MASLVFTQEVKTKGKQMMPVKKIIIGFGCIKNNTYKIKWLFRITINLFGFNVGIMNSELQQVLRKDFQRNGKYKSVG